MSDDFLAQTQANIATSAANQARWDALEARRRSYDAENAARQAASDAKEAKERALHSERLADQLADDNAALRRVLNESTKKQEALSAIPYYRQEIEQNYGTRQRLRDEAAAWLAGGQLPADAATSTQSLSNVMLAYAMEYSAALVGGDEELIREKLTRLVTISPLRGRLWSVLDGWRRTGEVDPAGFQALCVQLQTQTMVNEPTILLLIAAASGQIGSACRTAVLELAQHWAAAITTSTSDHFQMSDVFAVLGCNVNQVQLPFKYVRPYSAQAMRYHEAVAGKWKWLTALNLGLDRGASPLVINNPLVLLSALSKSMTKEEAEMRAQLCYYETLVKPGSDVKLAEAARDTLFSKIRALEWTIPYTVAALGLRGLGMGVFSVLTNDISASLDKTVAATELRPAPFYGNEQKEGETTLATAERLWKKSKEKDAREWNELEPYEASRTLAIDTLRKEFVERKRRKALKYILPAVAAIYLPFGPKILPALIYEISFSLGGLLGLLIAVPAEIFLYTLLVSWLMSRFIWSKQARNLPLPQLSDFFEIPDEKLKEWGEVEKTEAGIESLRGKIPVLMDSIKAKMESFSVSLHM